MQPLEHNWKIKKKKSFKEVVLFSRASETIKDTIFALSKLGQRMWKQNALKNQNQELCKRDLTHQNTAGSL